VGGEYRGSQSERYGEYVYFPSHLTDSKVYVVRQHNDEPLSMQEEVGSVVSPLAILSVALCVAGCIWFWIRSPRKVQPNNSLQADRER
jgi:hypothetical protein